MKKLYLFIFALLLTTQNLAYAGEHGHGHDHGAEEGAHNEHGEEPEKGPKGGKILRDGDFAVELTIFEQGVPPQFRVYAYEAGELVEPAQVELSIELHRLDGEVNRFAFTPQGEVLVGDGVVTEPHSFEVKVQASYKGKTSHWAFGSFEGRTQLSEQAAQEAGVKTEKAGAATIDEYARLTGRIILNPNRTAKVRGRFSGIVKSVRAELGQQVKKGDVLAKVESNQSLRSYNVVAPMDGVVLARNTNQGDVAGEEPLFTIADLSEVWAEFHVFPSDLPKVKQGQIVKLSTLDGKQAQAPLKMLLPTADAASQTVLAIVPLDNSQGQWRPGMMVKGKALINQKQVPLAVKLSALQKFRDFTVVFAKVNDTYEVRMLELGIRDDEQVEVLGGLKPRTDYVTENSFLIKADVEKSGASHDH